MPIVKKFEHNLKSDIETVIIHGGGVYASGEPAMIHTLLGSCVATCLYDPSTKIGGMNHFLLPGDTKDPGFSARYGINAMEILINEMMSLGANRRMLQAKFFGGGDIISSVNKAATIGQSNIAFVQQFLTTERIPLIGHRIGKNEGLIVHMVTSTFEVFVRPIEMEKFRSVISKEVLYRKKLTEELTVPPDGNITLF